MGKRRTFMPLLLGPFDPDPDDPGPYIDGGSGHTGNNNSNNRNSVFDTSVPAYEEAPINIAEPSTESSGNDSSNSNAGAPAAPEVTAPSAPTESN